MKEQFPVAEEKFFGGKDPLGDIAQAKQDAEKRDKDEKQKAEFNIKVDKMIERIKSENHKDTDFAAQDWECSGCGVAPTSIDLSGTCMSCGMNLRTPEVAMRFMAERLIREEKEKTK